jgi:Mlc titration factor MtfA (ptsG expression regulator)
MQPVILLIFILAIAYTVFFLQKKIKEIMHEHSDINRYGATNEAEFFAVVSEYFFERPELLKERHPELYGLLQHIFNPRPVAK